MIEGWFEGGHLIGWRLHWDDDAAPTFRVIARGVFSTSYRLFTESDDLAWEVIHRSGMVGLFDPYGSLLLSITEHRDRRPYRVTLCVREGPVEDDIDLTKTLIRERCVRPLCLAGYCFPRLRATARPVREGFRSCWRMRAARHRAEGDAMYGRILCFVMFCMRNWVVDTGS